MNETMCGTCGEWMWNEHHRCLPLWHAWLDVEDRKDARRVRGADDENAAARFVERAEHDAVEYPVGTRGEMVIVCVVPIDAPLDAAPSRIEVRGEVSIEYYAARVETGGEVDRG